MDSLGLTNSLETGDLLSGETESLEIGLGEPLETLRVEVGLKVLKSQSARGKLLENLGLASHVECSSSCWRTHN